MMKEGREPEEESEREREMKIERMIGMRGSSAWRAGLTGEGRQGDKDQEKGCCK